MELYVHHIMPMQFGGEETNPSNMLTLCKSCHLFMHCNPKLILKEKIHHSNRTKEGQIFAKDIGKRGRDKKPRKRRGLKKELKGEISLSEHLKNICL